ncbi:LysM peptidoglycan-binding domain-containing protein [Microbacterium caowuchunii]|uniref:LysM domain-containing protein n=1 Tax=Microbacterium caowuchunii TaxID=2614638 RepID=UPI001243F4B3|nr:LysM domain-containing protein [Microbacterium caowuchunii]QEV99185.1 LysM peptidoglycan-binding domain-containing protein [Microbacterium caowuchunii]
MVSVVAAAQSVGGNAALLLDAPQAVAATDPSTMPDLPDGYVDLGEGVAIPAGGPGDCVSTTWINITKEDGEPWNVRLLGADLVDMGPREFAVGEVGYSADGRIAAYTVAAGDSPWAIGDRFCFANGNAIPLMNGHRGYEAIQPGEVLVLDPVAVPGFEYHYPYEE